MARLRMTGNGSGDVEDASPEELAFQLTDAQFSVIALATPGEPSVVIDRIAYTPYGESTRTLRSDVNGDGVVNDTDYNEVIANLLGVSIGTARYRVEADLNRDGSIDEADYDLCIADDGLESSGGVGEAGLFSAGVRNSVGYCGYIHNEDTGLYTVRFRTYSPVLGRWLTRDLLGYVDGMALYGYVGGGATNTGDPTGLYSPADATAGQRYSHRSPISLFGAWRRVGKHKPCSVGACEEILNMMREVHNWITQAEHDIRTESDAACDYWIFPNRPAMENARLSRHLFEFSMMKDARDILLQLHGLWGENGCASKSEYSNRFAVPSLMPVASDNVFNVTAMMVAPPMMHSGRCDVDSLPYDLLLLRFNPGPLFGAAARTAGRCWAPIAAQGAAGRRGMTYACRWGKSGSLESGDWVMRGPISRINYLCSFKWQRGHGNMYAPYEVGEQFLVLKYELYLPHANPGAPMWLRVIERPWKGVYEQRRYYGPGAKQCVEWID